jgi:hypothetical protein
VEIVEAFTPSPPPSPSTSRKFSILKLQTDFLDTTSDYCPTSNIQTLSVQVEMTLSSDLSISLPVVNLTEVVRHPTLHPPGIGTSRK